MDAVVCKCPLCGAQTVGRLRWDSPIFETERGSIVLSGLQGRIFDALWRRKPVDGIDALAALVYADDPDGGPEHIHNVLSTSIARVRSKIEPLGYSITRNSRQQSGWRLIKIVEAA